MFKMHLIDVKSKMQMAYFHQDQWHRFLCAVGFSRSSEQMQTASQKQFVSGFLWLLCHFLLRVLLIEELLVIEGWFWVRSGDFAEIKALFRLSENPNTDKKRESTILPTDTHRQCSLLENSTLRKCCTKRMQLRNHPDTQTVKHSQRQNGYAIYIYTYIYIPNQI